MSSPGYVRSYKNECEFLVKDRSLCLSLLLIITRYEEAHPNMGRVDNNSCKEGTVAGGLLGGALGGVLSKKENWIWAIPSGMVAGAMIGCQVDGG